jgi:predicted TIM-barrel fold metal-dependent hydrolase
VHDTVAIFGAKRCLYGSNFPIEKLWTSYGELMRAFLKAANDLSAGRQKAIFYDTAKRVYRL